MVLHAELQNAFKRKFVRFTVDGLSAGVLMFTPENWRVVERVLVDGLGMTVKVLAECAEAKYSRSLEDTVAREKGGV